MVEKNFIEKFGVNFEEFAEMYFEKYGEKPIIRDVIKNNSSYTGFSIVSDGCSVSPNINLDLFVDLPNVSKLVDKVHDVYQHALKNVPICNTNEIKSVEYIKDNVFFKLLGSENNAYLDDAAYHPVTDGLCLAYFVRVYSNVEGVGSFKLTSETLEKLELDINELFACATRNTQDFFPSKFRPMSEILGSVDMENDDCGMFCLTNETTVNGATTVCYPGQMLDVLEKLHCDSVYVIPSSVHECLILRDDGSEKTVKDLRHMIHEVNTYEVQDDEILSYNLYRYDREKGLHIA